MGNRAFEVPGFQIPGLVAAESLTGDQYRWVRLTEYNAVSEFDANTDMPIGVLQNKPASGEAAEVMATGISFVVCGGSIDVSSNPRVGPDAAGKAVARAHGTDATKYVGGIALSDGADGQIIPVLLVTPYLAVTGN